MEFYLILGVLLFIAGVAGTFVYDHFKKEIAEHGGFFKAKPSKPAAKKYTKHDEVSASEQFLKQYQAAINEQKMAQLKSKARRTSGTVTARDGSVNSTMTVEELMRKLERMKRDI